MDQASHNGLVAGSSPAGPTNLPNKIKGRSKTNGLASGSSNLSADRATLVASLMALALAGCSPSAEEVGAGSYDPAKLSYFQDRRTGLCFAVSSYSRMDTGGRWSGGVSHASVPCSEPVMRLAR